MDKNRFAINEKYRLAFHLMPPKGWLNDPNGLCFYQGYYHVFFQYSPEEVHGGEKCWGHYRSEDLIHWEFLGVPFVPDIPEDKDGVYSGCAFVDDGVMEIFYTGNVKESGDHDYIYSGRGANVIYARSEDGIHFSEKEVLLTNEDYPASYTCHIRDPKVWKEGEKYYMVLGGRKGKPGDEEDKGAVLLYQSEDKKAWSFVQEIQTTDNLGYMWECPDYYEIQGTKILSICPQGRTATGDRFLNGDSSGYMILEEGWQSRLSEQEYKEWDKGFDFYAPQTFQDEQGRRILIGWVGLPAPTYTNESTIQEGWQHCLTVPREISVQEADNETTVFQYPVEELENLRKDCKVLQQFPVELEENAWDAEIWFRNPEAHKVIALNAELVLEYAEGLAKLRFTNHSGEGRKERIAKISNLRNVRILKDTSIVEYYLNDGEVVFTTRYYPKNTQQTSVDIQGETSSVTVWSMM